MSDKQSSVTGTVDDTSSGGKEDGQAGLPGVSLGKTVGDTTPRTLNTTRDSAGSAAHGAQDTTGRAGGEKK